MDSRETGFGRLDKRKQVMLSPDRRGQQGSVTTPLPGIDASEAKAQIRRGLALIIGAYPESLLNFRGPLIAALIREGWEVIVMSAPAGKDLVTRIETLGARHVSYPVSRNGLSPLQDLQTFMALRHRIRKLRPALLISYTVKPVIYTGIAAIGLKRSILISMITGFGYALQESRGARGLLKFFVKRLYTISLGRSDAVLFQNSSDKAAFEEAGIVRPTKTHLISGSGVDLNHFQMAPLPDDSKLTYLLIARLLKSKGIQEYAEAARAMRGRQQDVRFLLVGAEDPSPDAMPISDIEKLSDEGIVEYLGTTEDVRPYIRQCHVYVLPSYREGMPRTVLEAMAMGRPVLTTDAPGCRESIEDGVNGKLVAPRSSKALLGGLQWFYDNRKDFAKFATESRKRAERIFDVQKVNGEILAIVDLVERKNDRRVL